MSVCTCVWCECCVHIVHLWVCAHFRTKRHRQGYEEGGRRKRNGDGGAGGEKQKDVKMKREQKPPHHWLPPCPQGSAPVWFAHGTLKGQQSLPPPSMQESARRGHRAGDGGAGLKPADSKSTVCLRPTGASTPAARGQQSMVSSVISGHKGRLFPHNVPSQKILLWPLLEGLPAATISAPSPNYVATTHWRTPRRQPQQGGPQTGRLKQIHGPVPSFTSHWSRALELRQFTSSLPRDSDCVLFTGVQATWMTKR